MFIALCYFILMCSAVTVDECSGYAASNVQRTGSGLTADLNLVGDPCNVFGYDLGSLKLQVEYQTSTRLHLKITDSAEQAFQIPESVLPRPNADGANASASALVFSYIQNPFSFAIQRRSNLETIFNTSGTDLIFESQYLRLRTLLPDNPNLYGLGEHTDPFKLPTTGYTRTLWSRDAYEIPSGTNLYGNHPIYFENRGNDQSHGIFLANSNGMDIKVDRDEHGQWLEYNSLGGVIDLYILAGPGPLDVTRQYSQVVGTPAMMPYWSLGFHQCRYGYQDIYEVASVITNYSANHIPLETMWTDIDYMDRRKVFTLDPNRFPLKKVRELVDFLHGHDQHYIMMVDPAVAYQDYPAFNGGADESIFLKNGEGSIYQGVVWPGITAFPDWFNPETQNYWDSQFDSFFNADTGVDIDGLWIDMNEASNFCPYPCVDPSSYAAENGYPPKPPPVRPYSPILLPGFPPDFQPPSKRKRAVPSTAIGLPNRDLLTPPYSISNAAGSLSNKTIATNLIHGGPAPYTEYDTHNLYGTLMSSACRNSMLSRRPSMRPLVITRSTFAGAGRVAGHWTGDNTATWKDYRISIAAQIAFAGIYQIPMVGSDVCGYARNTTETLCARWAMLGAFGTFYRNHAESGKLPQEFYLWESVAEAARRAIDIRYRMLDYLYTALWRQGQDGTPTLMPLWFLYPNDAATYAIDTQFFFGDAVLVSPVIEEDATSVSVYLPDHVWYAFPTLQTVQGEGAYVQLNDVNFTTIPLHVRGGCIVPTRNQSAMTTRALRGMDFSILVAPDRDGMASGSLYLDDGVSLIQEATSDIQFEWRRGVFEMSGSFRFNAGVDVGEVVVLGQKAQPEAVKIDGESFDAGMITFDNGNGAVKVAIKRKMNAGFVMEFA